jgi:hypothetical protein
MAAVVLGNRAKIHGKFRRDLNDRGVSGVVRNGTPGHNPLMLQVHTANALVAALLLAAPAAAENLLLIPDTSRDKIWAFNAYDGSLVSNNYIASDGRMKQVIQVAQTPQGTILMSDVGTDQNCSADDAVREYSRCGQYIRTLAGPADGVCNPQGICIAYGKVWFMRLFDAAFETGTTGRNAIWSMNYDGTGLQEVCASSTFGKTWSMFPYNGGFLVSDIQDSNLEFAPLNCAASAPFYAFGQGGVSMQSPQQISTLADGTVVAQFFSGNAGIAFFSPTGELQGLYSTLTGRGVYPLGNGEILLSGGTQVQAYNLTTGQLRTIVNQVSPLASFRWIAPVTITPCPSDLDCSGTVDGADLGTLLGNWNGTGSGDINGDGVVNGSDLGVMLGNWGPCS